jgi:hypothetical protein
MFLRLADELNSIAFAAGRIAEFRDSLVDARDRLNNLNANTDDVDDAIGRIDGLGNFDNPLIDRRNWVRVVNLAEQVLQRTLRLLRAVDQNAELVIPADDRRFWEDAVNSVFLYRPVDLLDYLERYWSSVQGNGRNYVGDDVRNERTRRALGEPARVGQYPHISNVRGPVGAISDNPGLFLPGNYPRIPSVPDPERFPNLPEDEFVYPVWQHLIYAYAIENTRIVEIFRRVLREMLTGERLGRPNPTVLSWLRDTEELFFTDRLGHWIFSPVSRLRDDAGAIRRNAYYRMFGMDLNHGMEDGRSYPYPKPDAANRDFASTFEQLLRETWRGYANRRNQIGMNSTDNAYLGDLVLKLHDMLMDRRMYGNLAREEFYSVATLSWFHLTVSANTQVVTTFQAHGNNAADRLRAIGERVGLPAHTRAYNYFLMANELSEILSQIETGALNATNTQNLYDDTIAPRTANMMLTILNHWSAATGRNLKEFVGVPGQYLPQTSFAMPASLVQQGGNGYHKLARAK